MLMMHSVVTWLAKVLPTVLAVHVGGLEYLSCLAGLNQACFEL